jgi:hypothetical protein
MYIWFIGDLYSDATSTSTGDARISGGDNL